MADFAIKMTDGKAHIFTPYNKLFVERVKLMGARWNASERCWMVDERDIDDVRTVMNDIYGRDDRAVSETVDVELTFDEDVCGRVEPVIIMGRTIAAASGRDSGARIGDGVMFLKGKPESGGSAKNWETIVPEGCVVKLARLPKTAVETQPLPDGVRMRVLSSDVDRASLLTEKERLLARLAEIEEILNR